MKEAVKTEQSTVLNVSEADGKCKIRNGEYERVIEIKELQKFVLSLKTWDKFQIFEDFADFLTK